MYNYRLHTRQVRVWLKSALLLRCLLDLLFRRKTKDPVGVAAENVAFGFLVKER